MTSTRRSLALGGAGLVLAWIVVGWWLAPLLIEQGYRGESVSFVNDVFGGRDVHPVDRYLDSFRKLYVGASLVMMALGVLVLGLYRVPRLRQRVVGAIVGAGPGVDGSTLVWLAVQAGLLGGLSEAVYQAIRQAITQRPAALFYTELFWMAPLSAALATSVLGAVMISFARLGGGRWDIGRVVTVFGFLLAYGVLRSEGIPLHWLATAILALGIGMTLGRTAAAHPDAARRVVGAGRSIAVLTVLAALMFAWFGRPALAERRALDGREAAGGGLPNILIIILDTVRSQNLSLYGYDRPTTPELEDWARDGVVFEEAIATAPWTLPTHASLFTGLYNHDLGTSFVSPLDERFVTLSEILVRHGYQTGGFVANSAYTTDMSGLEQGFDRWEDWVVGVPMFLESSWVARSITHALTDATGLPRKGADLVTSQFLQWDVEDGRPFFAFLNYFDAHSAYPTPPAFEPFGPLPTEPWHVFKAQWQSDPEARYTVEETRLWVNKYDNAIAYIDHHLGLLRDSLEARNQLDNTIVVIASDHGESWGENGQLEHAQSLYRPTLRVPLMVSFPGTLPAGRRIGSTVSLVDVPATVLELAGVTETLPGGHSLAPLWSDDPGPAVRSRALSELAFSPIDATEWTPVWRGDMKSLVSDRYHFILNGDDVPELYELAGDPLQERDLAGDPSLAPMVEAFRATLDSLAATR